MVTRLLASPGVGEEELLARAAALEVGSEHPLAGAIVDAAKKRDLEFPPVEDFEAVSGRGVSGDLQGRVLRLGSSAFMEENGIEIGAYVEEAGSLAAEGATPTFLAMEDRLLGLIAIADPIKQDSKEAIQRLHTLGLRVVLLTGDNRRTAETVGGRVAVDQVIAEVMPGDKADVVAGLQQAGNVVAMVGDGINDAPALSQADVGVAIGTGADIAIESADIALMHGSLHGVADSIALSRATLRNIKQNLFGAFVYNILGIPFAAGVFYPLIGVLLNPMIAAAAMSMSSVTVVSNALRLRRTPI